MASAERFWTRRLRWRLLGAWRWPAFAVFTTIDAVILHDLGVIRHWNLAFAFIVASFGNIALLIAADLTAKFAERQDRARGVENPHLEVALDRGGVALMAVGALGLAASGIATHHIVVSETNATTANAHAVERWVNRYGTAEYRRNLETANTAKLADDYFRTCVADDHRRHFLCLFVDTRHKPPIVQKDASEEPNPPQREGGP